MITSEQVEKAVEDWIFERYTERNNRRGRPTEVVKPLWWHPDWSDYIWGSPGRAFEITGLELPLIFVQCWVPAGEDYYDFNGPQYMIFQYGDQFFAKAGRNLSHVGADFEGEFYEVVPEQVLQTAWTRTDSGYVATEVEEPTS